MPLKIPQIAFQFPMQITKKTHLPPLKLFFFMAYMTATRYFGGTVLAVSMQNKSE